MERIQPQRVNILQRVVDAVDIRDQGQRLKDITLYRVHGDKPLRSRIVEPGFGVVHAQNVIPVVAGVVRLRVDAPVRAGDAQNL